MMLSESPFFKRTCYDYFVKITFVSNFLNHHQLPFCEAMDRLCEGQFTFVATERIPDERKRLGYSDMNESYSFVLREYEEGGRQKAKQAMLDADICLVGSCSFEHHKWLRKAKKTYFMETERFFKGDIPWLIRFLKKIRYFSRYSLYKKNYLLCMSAYTYPDMLSFGAFRDRGFRFGYFPPMEKVEDIPSLLDAKQPNSVLWAGRFLSWKHPEFMVSLGKYLREKNVPFHIDMVGEGPEKERIEAMIAKENLSGYISLTGSLPAKEVREKMKSAKYFCFTSDSNEGWGAVCNEAMNSACLVIANQSIGSVPYLLKDGENGFVYQDSVESFLEAFSRAYETDGQRAVAENAYRTIECLWNAEVAAKRFFEVARCAVEKKPFPRFENGPLSKETKR